ncbi:MAG: polyprenyl synthetase family protein [candidate division Zixibacteria bacterium]|nr:polyprenyl synthetase family protein [candidate division Zixibacteria bacterium]
MRREMVEINRKEDFKEYLQKKRAIIERALDGFLPDEKVEPKSLHKAMRYSVFAGGKRLRPILAIASFEAVGGKGKKILPVACALEMIHTYSLIHDDLPCMDNDDLRRGKPTLHKVYGEGMAVLGGDALHALAFELLLKAGNPQVVLEVTKAIGTEGMIGGQVKDLEAEGKKVSLKQVEYIHTHKTGKLLRASIRAGAILGGADKKTLLALTYYAERFGLAFQIVDDILDVVGKEEEIGKKRGSDKANSKATYPEVAGLEKSKSLSRDLLKQAKGKLDILKEKNWIFEKLADYIYERIE